MQIVNLYKAPKGLIRIHAEVIEGVIKEIKITGDFFMVPEQSVELLEKMLKGASFTSESVSKAVFEFYGTGVSTPMLGKEDMINAIIGAKSGS